MANATDTIGSGEFRLPYDYFELLLTFLAAHGVPLKRLQLVADVTPEQLLGGPSFVGHITYNAAISLLMEATQDPYIPVKFGLAMSHSSHGMFGLAMRSSKDLADVYEILPSLFVTRSGHAQTVTTQNNQHSFELIVHSGRGGTPDELHRFNAVSTLVLLAWLSRKITGTDDQIIPDEIDLIWPDPGIEMPDLLPPGTKVRYSSDQNLLRHEKRHLRSRLISSNPSLQQAAIRECELQLASPPKTDIVAQIRWVFRILYPALPKLEDVAKLLHMSAPTLKRRLQASQTTFHEIKDDIRFDRVLKLLESNEFTLHDIAEEVDFNNASNLTKAFKHRFDCTPGEYRRTLQTDLD